jgi:hypothetical protein
MYGPVKTDHLSLELIVYEEKRVDGRCISFNQDNLLIFSSKVKVAKEIVAFKHG